LPGVPAIPVGENELDVILSHLSERAAKSTARSSMVAEKAYISDDAIADMEQSTASRQNISFQAASSRRMNYDLWKSAQQQFTPKGSAEEEKTWRKESFMQGHLLFAPSGCEGSKSGSQQQ
jgi:hypothetical protein